MNGYSQLNIPFTNNLLYKCYDERKGKRLSANEQTFLINGKQVSYKHHPDTLSEAKLARPRVQLT